VVPVFNEEPGIEQLWAALESAGERARSAGLVDDWEGVLVDDGSLDGSAALLDAVAARSQRAVVVHHGVNRGLGAALGTGLEAASGDVVLYTDADLPFDLGLVDELIRPVVEDIADMVSARRVGRAREGTWRAVQSLGFNLLVRVACRMPVRDVNFACKVARRCAVPPSLASTKGMVDIEWLLYARDAGARIIQPKVEFVPRQWGRSTLGSMRTIPGMLADIREVKAARRSWRDG